MDLNQIREILALVREHELSEFEIEHEGLRLKIRKDANGAHLVTAAPATQAVVMPASSGAAVAASPAPVATSGASSAQAAVDAGADAEIELAVVKSPIVGTFYRSS